VADYFLFIYLGSGFLHFQSSRPEIFLQKNVQVGLYNKIELALFMNQNLNVKNIYGNLGLAKPFSEETLSCIVSWL
jgi:hypothetical protein